MQRVSKPAVHGQRTGRALHTALGRGALVTNIAANQTIFAQGAVADAAYYIHSGVVKIVVLSKSGQEAVVNVLTAGSLFGQSCLFKDTSRVASAIAMSTCVIERIPAAGMRRALDSGPQFSRLLIESLLKRARQLQENLIDQHFHSTELRLARTLLRLSNIDGGGKQGTSLPRISQAMLAEMIGTTRSRVNFFMNKFRRLGLIDYNGKLVVYPTLSRILRER